MIYMCGGSNFHPYECSHDKYCEHCTQAKTDWHEPKDCAFCIDDGVGDPFVKEPFATRIRVHDVSHRYQKIKLTKLLTTITSKPQEELPF